MDSKDAQKIKILDEIEDTFKKHRLELPEQASHFPDGLKRLPLLALSEGIPQRDAARAAGLTPKSMRYLRNRFAEEQVGAAKKLKLVEQRLEPIESGCLHQVSALHIYGNSRASVKKIGMG